MFVEESLMMMSKKMKLNWPKNREAKVKVSVSMHRVRLAGISKATENAQTRLAHEVRQIPYQADAAHFATAEDAFASWQYLQRMLLLPWHLMTLMNLARQRAEVVLAIVRLGKVTWSKQLRVTM
jgi:hypothetical protein